MVDPKRSAAAKKAAATRAAKKKAAASPFFAAPPARKVPVLTPTKKKKAPQVGGSWATIDLTPRMGQLVFSKLKPAEHEARQSEAVRRADAAVLRAYHRHRAQGKPETHAKLQEALAKQREAVKASYTAAGLKYKAPESRSEATRKRKAKMIREERSTQAQRLYDAAKWQPATFRARRWEQVAVEKHHRGQISAADLARAKRHSARTQHADWLRLLREHGLTQFAKTIKAPGK
jgi:hypothetical protein